MDFSPFSGIPIIESPFFIEKIWNFKESKYRSRRQHKKLIKKFGVQYYERPAAYMIAGKLTAHPEIIKKMMEDKRIVKASS